MILADVSVSVGTSQQGMKVLWWQSFEIKIAS